MKYLKIYENFTEIERYCRKYNIDYYTITQDGKVDVDGPVYLGNIDLRILPLEFGKVNGNFECDHNQLTSLKGSPVEVGRSFHCSYNQLSDLIGGPKKVTYHTYYCTNNQIHNLKGIPEFYIDINFSDNPISEIIDLYNYTIQKKFIFWLNEHDVIRDGNKIVEMRLEEAYWMTTKHELPMNMRTFKNYALI